MPQNSTETHGKIDLEINSDPYRSQIAENHDYEFLRMLCDALDVTVSILDEDMNYQFISKSVYSQLAIDETELKVGDPLSHMHDLMLANGMMTPEILEQNKLTEAEQIDRTHAHKDTIPLLVKLGDGSTHRHVRKAMPNGYTVSMSDNVSELVEKDQMLDKALALGNSGYWTYDFVTKAYFLSGSLRRYFSKEDQAKIKDQGIIAVVHPEDRRLFRQAFKVLNSANNKFEVACRTNSFKGNERWSHTTGEVIRDRDGKAVKIRAFVKDITRDRRQAQELERAKDEAIAASHAKSEFLANMSHEIRTPMNGILGMAELLANSNIGDRQREFVDVINNSASALLTIINDILDFSKIEAGAFEIDPMPLDLKNSITDVTSLLAAKAQEKNLELIINYPTNLERQFIGDAGRLRQVITNLLGNAIKFTEAGHIIIDVEISPPRNGMSVISISVTDTGIGIEPEKISKVFQKFTQADGSTTRVYGGTGLGLSISKAIVEMMDGRISVRSELGKGSTFAFRIPLPIDSNARVRVFDTATLAGKRALIVDDIAINRTLLSEQLKSWDIRSEAVKDGVEALTQLKNEHDSGNPYDFILLDYLMPGMNGQELAAMITANADLSGTPIIMLSSCDQPISSQELTTIGIDSYLVKPVREKRLFETIVRTLTLDAQQEKTLQTAIAKPAAPISEKTEILVAEDFPLNQDVIRLMLGETPFVPVFVNNGLEAVEMFKTAPGRFPVILMDVSMPVMDGHEAARTITAFERGHGLSHTPIIALTGHAMKNDRDECLNAGMDDYLTKPVKQSALLEKLEHWTGRVVEARLSA